MRPYDADAVLAGGDGTAEPARQSTARNAYAALGSWRTHSRRMATCLRRCKWPTCGWAGSNTRRWSVAAGAEELGANSVAPLVPHRRLLRRPTEAAAVGGSDADERTMRLCTLAQRKSVAADADGIAVDVAAAAAGADNDVADARHRRLGTGAAGRANSAADAAVRHR